MEQATTSTFSSTLERLRAQDEAKVDLVLNTREDVEMIAATHREKLLVHGTDEDVGNIMVRFSDRVPELGGSESTAGVRGRSILPVQDQAHRQIAARSKVPLTFYRRLAETHPDLLAHTVSALWRREPKPTLVRAFRGGTEFQGVRAMLSDRYRVVDNLPFLMAALQEAEQHGAKTESAHVDDTRLYVKLLTPRVETVRAGDAVQAGAIIRNSEVGDGLISVAPFVKFLVCSNGMVSDTQFNRVHLGGTLDVGIQSSETQAKESEYIFSAVRDWLRHALGPDSLEEIVEQIKGANATRIDTQPRLAVANIVRKGGLTQAEGDGVLERFLRADNDSHRTMVDAVTHLAHTGGHNYRRQVELEALGGKLLSMEGEQFKRLTARSLSDKDVRTSFSVN